MKKRLFYMTLSLVLVLAACGRPPQPTEPSPEEVEATAIGGTGLTGVYFNNMDFTGSQATRIDATINKAWVGSPITGIAATTYSVLWTGQIVPFYSEEVTFYLTHTDGARLMVNGQVLVNNWQDQAQVVDSGKVTLQAGVKYDIRLEYYRNATNPSLVKLEWQSARLTRRIVVMDRLFPTGSNTQAALDVIQANAKFQALGVTLDPLTSVVMLTQDSQLSVTAIEPNQSNAILAEIQSGSVKQLFRLTTQNNIATITNVLKGTSQEIGNLTLTRNANGTPNQAEFDVMGTKIARFLFGTTSSVPATSNISNIYDEPVFTPQQSSGVNWACEAVSPVPPDCAGDICSGPANNVSSARCAAITVIVGLGTALNGKDVVGALDSLFDWGRPQKAWDDYVKCVENGKTSTDPNFQCKVQVDVTPTQIDLGVQPLNSRGGSNPVRIQNSSASNASVQVIGTWTTTGNIQPSVVVYGELDPGEFIDVNFSWICDQIGSFTGTLVIDQYTTNSSPLPSVTVSVTLECIEGDLALKLPKTFLQYFHWCPYGSSCYFSTPVGPDESRYLDAEVQNISNARVYGRVRATGLLANVNKYFFLDPDQTIMLQITSDRLCNNLYTYNNLNDPDLKEKSDDFTIEYGPAYNNYTKTVSKSFTMKCWPN